MTGLWTPYGEQEPSSEQPSAEQHRLEQAPFDVEGPRSEDELGEDLAALEQELLSTPASNIVANHCYGLFQLAAMYLAQRPARLEDARLAIDAFAAVVETLGPRLGDAGEMLREGLSQVRLAFVEIAKAQTEPAAASAPKETSETNGKSAETS